MTNLGLGLNVVYLETVFILSW